METIQTLTSRFATNGLLDWIGVRPERYADLIALESVEMSHAGLIGDHYQSGGKRAVTLVQHEHLVVISNFLAGKQVEPGLLRRNLVVSGINLLGLRNRQFRIGDAVLEGSGICAPCSRMETAFGNGGYTAVRGHGGITARIIEPGALSVGDVVAAI
ncbi:MAG: MOSC domain-containing protein [Pseudomonadota bacterium]